MSDLSKFAEQLVLGYLDTPEGRGQVEKCVKDVLNRAIDAATGYKSAFREQVDRAIANALQLHQDIEIASYNDAILKILARQVEHATADAIERQVAERMQVILRPVPAEIKLSELVEQYREYLKDRAGSGCVCHGESRMTFTHHQSDNSFDYYGLDEDSGKPENKCAIRFGIYKGKLFSLTFRDSDIEERMFVGPLYGFHRLLFQMKAARASVVIDCTPDDVDLDYGDDV